MNSPPIDLKALLELSAGPAGHGVWEWDFTSDKLSISRRSLELLGLAEAPATLSDLLAFCRFDNSAEMFAALQKIAKAGGIADVRSRMRSPGAKGPVRLRAIAVDGEGAVPRRVLGILTGAADEDGNSQEHLAGIVAGSDDAIISKTLEGIVTSWNRGAERMFGYSEQEMLGRPIGILAPPGYEDDMPRILQTLRQGGRVDHYLTKRRHKNGSVLDISLTVSPMHDRLGRIIGASKIARDVTSVEKARVDAERREAQLRSILDTVPDGMILIDEKGLIISFSAAAERLFGYKAQEVHGRNVSLLMPQPDRGAHDGYLARYLATGERHIIGIGRRLTGLRKDGSHFHFELTVGEVVLPDKRMFTGFVHDLTESDRADARLSELQAELLHVSRLNAMGELSAMLAHELNQPLTAAINYAEAARHLLVSAGEAPPKVLDFVQKASAQAERAGQIIRRLRSFVEKREAERSREQLSLVVEEASDFAATGTKIEGIELIFDFANDLPSIEMDRTQIQQVVVNLVRNAIDALRQAPRRTITITTRADGEDFQEVSVIDSGPGIAPEMVAQLFKPFVTSKPDGMGIGLSVSQSIIEAHGGTIRAEPNTGGGTIFRFNLPVGLS
jgi:two-component system sensor kinase FixL